MGKYANHRCYNCQIIRPAPFMKRQKISYKSADFIIGLAPGIVDEILNNGIPKEKVVLQKISKCY